MVGDSGLGGHFVAEGKQQFELTINCSKHYGKVDLLTSLSRIRGVLSDSDLLKFANVHCLTTEAQNLLWEWAAFHPGTKVVLSGDRSKMLPSLFDLPNVFIAAQFLGEVKS